jgi:hypothetical protein
MGTPDTTFVCPSAEEFCSKATLVAVSTRKLILLALTCGLAILIAGTAQLFMVTH